MEFKIFTEPFQEWDAFCNAHSSLLFHTTAWFQVLRAGLRYPPMYYTLWEGNELVMGLPVFLMDYRFFRALYATIPYGTFLGSYTALPSFMPAIQAALGAAKIHALYAGGSYPSCAPLLLPGYTPKYQPVHVLSLQETSAESILQRYKSYARRGIRRAAKLGVRVEKIADRCEIESFYFLYLCAMRRNNAMAKYPKKFLYSIYDRIISKGQGDIFFAKLDGKSIAGIMVLYSRDLAHYYFGGSITEYQKYQPNEALFHHAIVQAIDKKKHAFDFMGSDACDTDLIHFKQKWGAKPQLTAHYTLEQNPFRCRLWNRSLRLLSSPLGLACTRVVQRLAAGNSHE